MQQVEATSPAMSVGPTPDVGFKSHESTTTQQTKNQEAAPSFSSTAESSVEHLACLEGKVPPLALPTLPSKEDVSNQIVCREWQTECQIASRHGPIQALSCIPEKDAVLWQIKDLTAFRSAAKVSRIPPLMSPEFGGGCVLRLQLYDPKGHISGNVEIPIVKATRDGVAHFKVSVVRPDMKVITFRKVEMVINVSSSAEKRGLERKSRTFRLSRARTFCKPSMSSCLIIPPLPASKCTMSQLDEDVTSVFYILFLLPLSEIDHLVLDDAIRIRVEFQYFPFDDPIFRGGAGNYDCRPNSSKMRPRGGLDTMYSHAIADADNSAHNTIRAAVLAAADETKAELLMDIRNYCRDDPSQYVEIRRDETSFQSCRFLLCARSKKFRDIFGSNTLQGSGNNNTTNSLSVPPLSARGLSPSRFAPFARASPLLSSSRCLSSITIQDISAECLDEMLAFIHTDSCQWLDDFSTDIFKVLELFEAADSYGVTSLSKRLLGHLQQRLETDNFVYMFEVSERCRNEDFKRICTQFMDSIPGSQVATLMRLSSIPSLEANTTTVVQ